MKYYLLKPDGFITGPFELETIEAQWEAGEISPDTLATGDIGESLGQVCRTPAEEWMPVKSIPGFGQERPRNLPPREASPPPPTLALPPPTELFPAHLWRKPQSPPEQIAFCPFCGQRAGGPVSLGETWCGQCGKVLYPATGTNRVPAPSRPESILMFIVGLIGGLAVQYISLYIVGLFGLAARKSAVAQAALSRIRVWDCSGRRRYGSAYGKLCTLQRKMRFIAFTTTSLVKAVALACPARDSKPGFIHRSIHGQPTL